MKKVMGVIKRANVIKTGTIIFLSGYIFKTNFALLKVSRVSQLDIL